MASATNQQSFRFMDLPPELRCVVYEKIEFPTTWHVLDRAQARLSKETWPVPPKGQIYDSRVTLIRPHTPIEILTTCRLVNEEAREILRPKAEFCKREPIRYLVDWSAASALGPAWSPLASCLGVAGSEWHGYVNKLVNDFIQLCIHHLAQTRRPRAHTGPRGVRAIEMTITHKSDVAYGMEVLKAVCALTHLEFRGPVRLVIIYKSPLPKLQICSNTRTVDSSLVEETLLLKLPRESGDDGEANSECGIFVRPLEEQAFDKHVDGQEWY